MIVHVLGRLVRLELLPPSARVARRWDGSDQAHPVTTVARLGLVVRRFGRSMPELSDLMSTMPRRPRPEYLRRHL